MAAAVEPALETLGVEVMDPVMGLDNTLSGIWRTYISLALDMISGSSRTRTMGKKRLTFGVFLTADGAFGILVQLLWQDGQLRVDIRLWLELAHDGKQANLVFHEKELRRRGFSVFGADALFSHGCRPELESCVGPFNIWGKHGEKVAVLVNAVVTDARLQHRLDPRPCKQLTILFAERSSMVTGSHATDMQGCRV